MGAIACHRHHTRRPKNTVSTVPSFGPIEARPEFGRISAFKLTVNTPHLYFRPVLIDIAVKTVDRFARHLTRFALAFDSKMSFEIITRYVWVTYLNSSHWYRSCSTNERSGRLEIARDHANLNGGLACNSILMSSAVRKHVGIVRRVLKCEYIRNSEKHRIV